MNTPWKWLSVSIGIGCLMIAVGILLRGHPTTAQYEELRLRLQALESRSKAEDSGLIARIENDAKAQAYAQIAYEGLEGRVVEMENSAVSADTIRKIIEVANSNFTQSNERAKDVNGKLNTLFELVSIHTNRLDSQDKNLKSLNEYIRNLVKQLNENRR